MNSARMSYFLFFFIYILRIYVHIYILPSTTTHYCLQPLHHHTKSRPHSVITLLSGSQALVRLLTATLAAAPSQVVLADARSDTLLTCASLAVVLADARPTTLLTLPSYVVVLADARPASLLAPASSTVLLADAHPAALLHMLLSRL